MLSHNQQATVRLGLYAQCSGFYSLMLNSTCFVQMAVCFLNVVWLVSLVQVVEHRSSQQKRIVTVKGDDANGKEETTPLRWSQGTGAEATPPKRFHQARIHCACSMPSRSFLPGGGCGGGGKGGHPAHFTGQQPGRRAGGGRGGRGPGGGRNGHAGGSAGTLPPPPAPTIIYWADSL